MSTHIRQDGALAYGLGTYCGAKPSETISLRHYRESLTVGTAQQGHVARLLARLCVRCIKLEARNHDCELGMNQDDILHAAERYRLAFDDVQAKAAAVVAAENALREAQNERCCAETAARFAQIALSNMAVGYRGADGRSIGQRS